MPRLRDYQRKLLKEVESGLESSKARLMLQLPTGGGKTVIAGELLARRLKADRKAAAVWLTHRVELADQTCRMLQDTGISAQNRPRWQSGDDAPRVDNGVAILTAQTVAHKEPTWTGYSENDLLVVDEAHHATAPSWRKAIQWWPGPVLGMTATPWRLSKKEGLDHLFDGLRLGPQTHRLQSDGWLCQAQVYVPGPDDIIRGGVIRTNTGDYYESGINKANRDRPDVLTRGVLRFWQQHAAERQTIIYAVSIGHADNLEREFKNAGIGVRVIKTTTPKGERAETVDVFRKGILQVLINVAIATEGFDLPDASCVVLARPTMSLSLYLQMVGRGLRPKPKGSLFRDCLILDLAGNTERHGLPEDEREWFLEARGEGGTGDAPVIRCEECERISPASVHRCVHCGASFGKDCSRCGKWRAWAWWEYETYCGQLHDHVCDLCHYDVHIEPVPDSVGQPPMLGKLHQLVESQIDEIKKRIGQLDHLLNDADARDREFDAHVDRLPQEERPKGTGATSRKFLQWERQLKTDREKLGAELNKIESANPDDLPVSEQIHQHLKTLLAQNADRNASTTQNNLDESKSIGLPIPAEINGGYDRPTLTTWVNIPDSVRVVSVEPPTDIAIPIEEPDSILIAVAEWLIKQKRLARKDYPIALSKSANVRCLINNEPYHRKGANGHQAKFKSPLRLSNGLYLENGVDDKTGRCEFLLERFGMVPAQFRVKLADIEEESSSLSLLPPVWSELQTRADAPDCLTFESIRTTTGDVISGERPGGLLAAVAEWLIGQGSLQPRHCPVKPPNAHFRFLVNDKPIHRNGNRFKRPMQLSNGLYLESGFDKISQRCLELLEHCGQNLSGFRVNSAEGLK